MPKAYFNWSSGKDSALALHYLQTQSDLQIDLLLTTVNAHHDRVSMHGLRRELLQRQIAATGLLLHTVELPVQPSMEEYDMLMTQTVDRLKSDGYTDCGFGDIYLQDLRDYREQQLEGVTCHFPLWKRDTKELLLEFIDLGFRAVIICVDNQKLDESFLGQELDQAFLDDLPDDVDPCGENGEYHTFCYAGPIFCAPVEFELGERTLRHYEHTIDGVEKQYGFWFLDLVPK